MSANESEVPQPGADPADLEAGAMPLVEEGELNLEALSQRLGPFNPPADFDHGEEFEPSIPRPIPSELRRGSYARRQWSTVLTLFVLGTGCIVFAPFTFVKKLSFHVLPLAYLHYIGYGLVGFAVLLAIWNRFAKARYVYVREGEPLVGRILGVFTPLRIVIDQNTKAVTQFFRYLAAVEYQDPETRTLERTTVISEDEWDVKKQSRFDPGIDAGDYVTLVRLPGRNGDSVRLYGFLGLDPERDYITRDGRPLAGVSPFTAVLISGLIVLAMWFLILGIYVLQYCLPREWSWSAGLPFLAVGAAVGAIGLAWLVQHEQRHQGGVKKSGLVLAGLGGAFLGALGGAVVMGAVNATFDKSSPKYEPIRINQHWMTTHNFVFRTYEIEYSALGGADTDKRGVSVDDLAKLGESPLGVLEVREGALGMEWVSAVHPAVWVRLDSELTEEDRKNAVVVLPPDLFQGDVPIIVQAPRLMTDLDGTLVPCPPEMVDEMIAELKRDPLVGQMRIVRLRDRPE